MLIVTIFNYPDNEDYNNMCKCWIQQAVIHCGDSRILILTEQDSLPPDVNEFASRYPSVDIEKKTRSNHIDLSTAGQKANHNILFKLYNLCNITEPFIFVDADAFFLSNYENLLKASHDKPFIAVNHQKIPDHTSHLSYDFFNSGMMVVSDPAIFDWNALISRLIQDSKFIYPGTDQSMLNSYFKNMNYDYTHSLVSFGWNSCAKYTVYNPDKTALCIGLGAEYAVHLNHFWWEYKPWRLGCPIFSKMKNSNGEL
jgi:hypothetical protein